MRPIIGRTRQSIYPKFAVKPSFEHFPSRMNDRPRKIENKFREKTIERSAAGRLIMGCQMFDTYRATVIASLPKDLPEEEFKKQLFERIYGVPMEDFLSGKVDDSKVRR